MVDGHQLISVAACLFTSVFHRLWQLAFNDKSALVNPTTRFLERSKRNMNSNLPAASFGHFVMKVDDIETSYQFYTNLGLRPFGIFPDLAIIELRGGTHILLFEKNNDLPFSLSPSHLGQRGAFFNERLDLMIDGKSKHDLELYRATLIEKGFSVDAIAQDQFFGHDYFQLADPDGNGITFYTSHTE
jgi:catechol 2,3-dioxygenase-like lactoylglutathione lyase family enzyme